MDNLTLMTDEAIAELERDPEVLNLRIVIEGQFDAWTQRLFPLLQLKNIPCYRFVTALLHKDGHTAATETLVGLYMRRIREKRNLDSVVRSKHSLKGSRGVTPTVTLTRPARELRADPVVRVQATDRPVAQAVSVPPVEAVPGVVPVEVTDWHAELRRLDTEGRSAVWTGADEWMWAYFKGCAKSMDKVLPKNIIDVENLLDDPIKVKVLHRILDKVET
ncbi:hypothetical protein [Variovorax sp. RA8]|uniref:hypothetical protein n=1 Tax=Variovorax sp. (strain JCM 16519 / RA8) TaxID=662548 RepID=UPI000A4E0E7F|nr:hypothetical protein [Variovorax sp. RA8]